MEYSPRITPAKEKFHDDNHAALKAAYEQLKAENVANLSYISGDKLYGTDAEGAWHSDEELLTDLASQANAPMFGIQSVWLGLGIVGGRRGAR